MTKSGVGKWERGLAPISSTNVRALAAKLNVSICDLYGVSEGHTTPPDAKVQIAQALGVDPDRVEINVYVGGRRQRPEPRGGGFSRPTIADWPSMDEDEREFWRTWATEIRRVDEERR